MACRAAGRHSQRPVTVRRDRSEHTPVNALSQDHAVRLTVGRSPRLTTVGIPARKQDSNTEFHRVGTELRRARNTAPRAGPCLPVRSQAEGANRFCSVQLCANSVKLCVRILLSCFAASHVHNAVVGRHGLRALRRNDVMHSCTTGCGSIRSSSACNGPPRNRSKSLCRTTSAPRSKSRGRSAFTDHDVVRHAVASPPTEAGITPAAPATSRPSRRWCRRTPPPAGTRHGRHSRSRPAPASGVRPADAPARPGRAAPYP